ncbi:MAG: hypothetical protein HRT77_16975, partial [Halioglobus sp.]|nr:hypothetical protein [Halioglobus sp.]
MAPTRRQLIKSAGVTTAAVPVLGSGIVLAEIQNEQPGCSEWRQPDDNDFAAVVQRDKAEFLSAVLTVIESEQIPLTLEGVRHG